MGSKAETAAKFSGVARGWSQREYRDPASFMTRRAAMVLHWGTPLEPGDRILELGCGDGTLSCLLAAQGFKVTGVDISPGMIEEARRQAEAAGLSIAFEVADGDNFKVSEPYDAVVSFMSAFFTYLEDPLAFIQSAAPFIRKKLILDWNFRSPGSFLEAGDLMNRAGLEQIEWRPWFISYQSVGATPGFRSWVEDRPNLSLLALILKRWHYTVYLKGERAGGNGNGHSVQGHQFPGSFLQRSLVKFGQLTR